MRTFLDILDDSLDLIIVVGMVLALSPFMRTVPAPIQPEEQAWAYHDYLNEEDMQ